MPKITSPFPHKKIFIGMIGILPIMFSSAIASDIVWTGAQDNNFWEENNWDWGSESPGSFYGSMFINGSPSGVIVSANSPLGGDLGGSLVIGNGLSNKATLDVYKPDGAYMYGNEIYLGQNGGEGTFNYTINAASLDPYNDLQVRGFTLGDGTNSQGTINIFGQGKQIHNQSNTKTNALIVQESMQVGINGGNGHINIDGGGMFVSMYSPDPAAPVFSLGAGTGSTSVTNIFGGGKLAVSVYPSGMEFSIDQSTVIGSQGGSGTLNIEGQIIGQDGLPLPSRAVIGQGLAIGQNQGSNGHVNISAGGLLRTFSNNNTSFDPSDPAYVSNTYKIEVGSNGGVGSAAVSGADSRWEVSGDLNTNDEYSTTGKLELGSTGNGTLTINNGGVVAIGKTKQTYNTYYDANLGYDVPYYDYDFISGGGVLSIAGSTMGKGTLNIGSSLADNAVAAGTIETDKIVFGAGNGQVIFNHTDTNYQFNPILEGPGKIVQKAGTTWLNGDNNALSGTIQIIGGTLGAANNDSLGSTNVVVTGNSTLAYANAITLNNSVSINSNATLSTSVKAGEVAIHNGMISGTGHLATVDTGTLKLKGVNTLTGEVRADAGILALTGGGSISTANRVVANAIFDISEVTTGIAAIKSLSGTGQVNLGTKDLTVTAAHDTFSGNITGAGTVSLTGGQLTLTGVSSYTGQTTIDNGLLIIQDIYNGNASIASQFVNIKADGKLGGYGTVAGDVKNTGTILVGSALNNSSNFGSFTIKGDYIGDNGLVVIGTVLTDDTAPSDRLVIKGDASGQSSLIVNNIHGAGAQTTDKGIEVIDIQGNSSAQFNLQGRAVAGAYEYFLQKDADGNWYLRSELDPNSGGNGAIYRPEVGSYLVNIATANNLFTHQLNDRTPQSIGKNGHSTWIRIAGYHGRFKDSTGQSNTTTDDQVVQMGGDILSKLLANNGVFKFGAMFGYGHTKSKTRSDQTSAHSTTSGDGYALGLYGTWFQNGTELSGAYVDTWLQYVHFENKVKGNYLRDENYNAKGLIASIEAGYTFKMSPNFYIQPQAQFTWMNVKADDHQEYNGTYVRSGGQGNIQMRLGIRLFGQFDLNNGTKLHPYAELNWLHNTKSYYVDLDGTRINQQGAKNIGQAKTGLNVQINQSFNIWGDVSYEVGKHSYRNSKLSIGFKYYF